MVTKKINNVIERFEDQYFYSEKVGTYLFNLSNEILLFDLPTYSKEIKQYLISKKLPIRAILSHGPCGIADGDRWQKELGITIFLHKADKSNEWLQMVPDVLFDTLPSLPETLELIHKPGHTPGSVCLLEKTTKSLLTGDTVEGTENGEIYDFTYQSSGTKERLISAEKLLQYEFENIFPFHYEPIVGVAKKSLKRFVSLHS